MTSLQVTLVEAVTTRNSCSSTMVSSRKKAGLQVSDAHVALPSFICISLPLKALFSYYSYVLILTVEHTSIEPGGK